MLIITPRELNIKGPNVSPSALIIAEIVLERNRKGIPRQQQVKKVFASCNISGLDIPTNLINCSEKISPTETQKAENKRVKNIAILA